MRNPKRLASVFVYIFYIFLYAQVDERAKQSADPENRFADKWNCTLVMAKRCVLRGRTVSLSHWLGLNRWALFWTTSGNDLLPLLKNWCCTWSDWSMD